MRARAAVLELRAIRTASRQQHRGWEHCELEDMPGPDIYGAITSTNGHNIFGSDVGANPAGDRENIAASAIFAAIDPDTGGGQLNASGVVPLRNNIDNPALSGADLLAAGCHRPDSVPQGPCRPAACPTSARSRSITALDRGHGQQRRDHRHGRRQLALRAGRQRLPQGPRRQGHAQRRRRQRSARRRDGQRQAQRRRRHRSRVLRRQRPRWWSTSATTDTAKRGSETDKLTGIEGAIGSSAGERFKGDEYDNWFQGGLGKDTFTGGSGRDLYDFNAVAESGVGSTKRDVITDFDHLVDDIDLMGIDANTTVAGNQAFRWVGTAALTGAGQLGFFTSGGNTIIHGSNDADAADEFQIQLNGMKALTVDDFYF